MSAAGDSIRALIEKGGTQAKNGKDCTATNRDLGQLLRSIGEGGVIADALDPPPK